MINGDCRRETGETVKIPSRNETAELYEAAERLKLKKVAVFVVAYNAEKHIEQLIARIPAELLPLFAEVFIIDDSSTDRTFDIAGRIGRKYPDCNINIYRTPFNRGYGGNQKLGYLYCMRKNYDIVILLHGDGQYAPEYLPKLLAGFEGNVDAVFASRMIHKKGALEGRMPLYKWVGNQILTSIQNKMLATSLSEFHTGYRAYKIDMLRKIPFTYNSDDFHFDTEIIVQLVAMKAVIKEIPVPTFYGDEECHVNGVRYAKECVKSVLKYHLVNMGLFYCRNYDFGLFETENYLFKKSPHSLHQYVLGCNFGNGISTIELGANDGILSSHVAARVREHWCVDQFLPTRCGNSKALAMDLNEPFSDSIPHRHFDACIALDVIEHMNEPEKFLFDTFQILKPGSMLYISTANIAYLPMRIMLLMGQFNYGKRGILDRTHKRLFNVRNFTRTLESAGFRVEKIVGFAPPVTDLVSGSGLMKAAEKIHSFLSRLYPPMFSYNFLLVAMRTDGIDDILDKTIRASANNAELG